MSYRVCNKVQKYNLWGILKWLTRIRSHGFPVVLKNLCCGIFRIFWIWNILQLGFPVWSISESERKFHSYCQFVQWFFVIDNIRWKLETHLHVLWSLVLKILRYLSRHLTSCNKFIKLSPLSHDTFAWTSVLN